MNIIKKNKWLILIIMGFLFLKIDSRNFLIILIGITSIFSGIILLIYNLIHILFYKTLEIENTEIQKIINKKKILKTSIVFIIIGLLLMINFSLPTPLVIKFINFYDSSLMGFFFPLSLLIIPLSLIFIIFGLIKLNKYVKSNTQI